MGEQQDRSTGRYGKRFPILSGLTCATFSFAGLLMAGEPTERTETVVWVPTRTLARHVVRTSSRTILRESRYAVGPMPGIDLVDAVLARADEPSMQHPAMQAGGSTRASRDAVPERGVTHADTRAGRDPDAEALLELDEEPRLAWIERITQASSLPESFIEGMRHVDPNGVTAESAADLTDAELARSAQMMARAEERDAHVREVLASAAAGERLARAASTPAPETADRGWDVPGSSAPPLPEDTAIQRAYVERTRTIRTPGTTPRGRVLCFGDCVTLGEWWEENIGQGTRWVDLLGDRSPDLHTINAGRDGLETRHGWYLREMLRTHPHIDTVILSLGVNDLRGTNRVDGARVSRARANMAEMIDAVRAVKPEATILLASPVGIAPDHLSRRWQNEQFGLHTVRMLEMLRASYEALAREKGVAFVNLTDAIPAAHLPDGVHPDQEGHETIARIFWEALGGEPQKERTPPGTLPVAQIESASDAEVSPSAHGADVEAGVEDVRAMAAPASGSTPRSEVILPPVASAEELTAAAMEAGFMEDMLLELQGRVHDPFEEETVVPSPDVLRMDALRYAENDEFLRAPAEMDAQTDSMPVRPEARRMRQSHELLADRESIMEGRSQPLLPEENHAAKGDADRRGSKNGSLTDFLSGLQTHEMPELEPTRLPQGPERSLPGIPGIPDSTLRETPRGK